MRRKRNVPSFILRTLSTILVAVLILACLPLTIPRIFGYEIYSVVSGSMEPSIRTGSLIYVREGTPEDVQEGEVIVFYGARDTTSIITHRVVKNRVVTGEFITKGDANLQEDLNPVPYAHYIGNVVRSIPHAGILAKLFTSLEGRRAAAGVILAAVVLQMLASLAERMQDFIWRLKE